MLDHTMRVLFEEEEAAGMRCCSRRRDRSVVEESHMVLATARYASVANSTTALAQTLD
jgi:hypothetical protein